jgi:hypothetical protein
LVEEHVLEAVFDGVYVKTVGLEAVPVPDTVRTGVVVLSVS